MKKVVFFLFLFFQISTLKAQTDTNTVDLDEDARVYCSPQLEGQGPSKGVVLSYRRVLDQHITSTSRDGEIGNASADLRRNNQLTVKLRLPAWNRPALKVIVGFEYQYQEFVFENATPDFDLYQNLQQKHLKTIGGNINVLKALDEKHYMVFSIKGDLNGDYSAKELPTIDFLKGSISALYGIKTCPTKTYGFGLHYNYTFGNQRLLPAFLYNNTFNEHWGVELLLPASARLRYNFNRSTLLYLGAEVDGASYNLVFNNPPLSGIDNLQLRRSAIAGLLEFNREIYDFIWFGVGAGILQPISFNLTEDDDKGTQISFKDGIQIVRGEPLIRNTLNWGPYFEVSLFLVPPRKLENKVINAR